MNTGIIANIFIVGLVIYFLTVLDKKTGFYNKMTNKFKKSKEKAKTDTVEELKSELEKEKIRSQIRKLKQ